MSPDFPGTTSGKNWSGFDVDLCRAIAAAILGDATKAAFRPIDILPRFLQSQDIDVVLRGLTWTFGREARSDVRFGPIVLYDGQTFLVPKRLNIQTPEQLSGKLICVSTDVEFMTQLQAYFRARNLVLRTLATALRPEAEDAFFAGQCDAMAADASELAEAIIAKAPQPDDFAILPQQITKEPLAPFMRNDDAQFFDAVRWTIFALINAEELGITQANVDQMRMSDNIEVRRFFAAAARGRERRTRLDLQHRQSRRELRRDLRTSSGLAEPRQARPRHESAVDRRRPDVRAAHSLTVYAPLTLNFLRSSPLSQP